MSLNDNATLVIGAGNYFTAPVDTPLPTDLKAPGAAWTNVGHTSIEEIFKMSSDGGEKTILSTLQADSLRTVYSKRTDAMGITVQQFDVASLKLYYGSNATIGAQGEVQVPTKPQTTKAAWLSVFLDGTNVFAFYAPKAEIFRGDDIAVAKDALSGLPLSITPVISGTNAFAYSVTPLS